jgi:hypothetical protein
MLMVLIISVRKVFSQFIKAEKLSMIDGGKPPYTLSRPSFVNVMIPK